MEFYKFSRIEFYKLLSDAFQSGASAALIDAGIVSPIISMADAVKKHTKHTINKLEKAGLIERKQREHRGYNFYGLKVLINALITENRHRFFKRNGRGKTVNKS